MVMGLYQLTIDTVQVLGAGPEQGLLALHLTFKDIWLTFLVGLIYVFQISRAGDH